MKVPPKLRASRLNKSVDAIFYECEWQHGHGHESSMVLRGIHFYGWTVLKLSLPATLLVSQQAVVGKETSCKKTNETQTK
jgi:hypothetical protein